MSEVLIIPEGFEELLLNDLIHPDDYIIRQDRTGVFRVYTIGPLYYFVPYDEFLGRPNRPPRCIVRRRLDWYPELTRLERISRGLEPDIYATDRLRKDADSGDLPLEAQDTRLVSPTSELRVWGPDLSGEESSR